MGVDFFACDECGETFADCGPFARCESCDQKLCPSCMSHFGVSGGMADMDDEDYSEDDYDQCPFCSLDAVSDKTLLEFALEKLRATKEELVAEFKVENAPPEPASSEPIPPEIQSQVSAMMRDAGMIS